MEKNEITERVKMINNSLSFDCIVNKGGSREFKAKIASEVHPVTNVVGYRIYWMDFL